MVIKDKKAILFFFATWCPHCSEQFKVVVKNRDAFAKAGIELVLVDMAEPKDTVAKFLKSRGVEGNAFHLRPSVASKSPAPPAPAARQCAP